MKPIHRKWLITVVFCLSVLLLGAAAFAESVHIWLATDTHHLSPELTDYGSLFYSVVYTNDGKRLWNVRPGSFIVKVGASSQDIRLQQQVTLNGELVSKPLRDYYFSESTVE